MKRFMTTALMAAATFGLCSNVQAKTLEEILKDKGVITEEDYKEATKHSDLTTYQPGKGITVQTEDGRYKAQVGGRLQARYENLDDDGAEDTESNFRIRRMKFWLQGNVFSKNLTYKWQQNFGGGDSVLEDAYFKYKVADPFSLSIGQFKPAQGRQELTSSGSQLFVDRSLANETFNLGYDLGLQASGQFMDKRLEYRLGVFNGNGPNQSNPDDNHMLAGRLDINPFGAFKMDEPSFNEKKVLVNIGASFATETMSGNDMGEIDGSNDTLDKALNIDSIDDTAFTTAFGEELDWTLYTLNLHAKYSGLTFGSEYFTLNADPKVGADWDADGYYIQAGYQILPKQLEVAARYSAIESTDAAAYTKFEKNETTLGVNYYFDKHNLKVQADYSMIEDDRSANSDENLFRLQAQVIF